MADEEIQPLEGEPAGPAGEPTPSELAELVGKASEEELKRLWNLPSAQAEIERRARAHARGQIETALARERERWAQEQQQALGAIQVTHREEQLVQWLEQQEPEHWPNILRQYPEVSVAYARRQQRQAMSSGAAQQIQAQAQQDAQQRFTEWFSERFIRPMLEDPAFLALPAEQQAALDLRRFENYDAWATAYHEVLGGQKEKQVETKARKMAEALLQEQVVTEREGMSSPPVMSGGPPRRDFESIEEGYLEGTVSREAYLQARRAAGRPID